MTRQNISVLALAAILSACALTYVVGYAVGLTENVAAN